MGKQKLAKFPPMMSYTNNIMKKGVIIGSIRRIMTQNTYRKCLLKHCKRNLFEMMIIGYSTKFISQALWKIRKNDKCKDLSKHLLHFVNHIMPHYV